MPTNSHSSDLKEAVMETIATKQEPELIFTTEELIFILAAITDLGRKDLEGKILWILSGDSDL